jgi:hypothetical protein
LLWKREIEEKLPDQREIGHISQRREKLDLYLSIL